MVTVIRAVRRSAILTSSSLACLSHMPTINLTAGCAHGCLYCYARGYTIYPGEDRVVLYENTLDKLKDEIARKRTKPQAVYFSPSSDLFQSVPEVLDLGHRILEFLFSQSIGVAFLSKGHIPDKTLSLLLSHADKVRAQIGIITLDEDIQRVFEPDAACPRVRLDQMAEMVAGGIATEARLIPVLPGVTDTDISLKHLFSALAEVGVRRATTSALFLRPSVLESLKRNVRDKEVLQRLLSFYMGAKRLATRAEHSSIIALPRTTRERIFERLRTLSQGYSIELSVCSCMNTDIGFGTCNIGGTWPGQPRHSAQPSLV